MNSRSSSRAAAIAFALSIVAAGPARAQSADDDVPSFAQLFTATLRGFQQLPTLGNLELLGIGGAAALAAHPADREVTRALADSRSLHEPLEAGAVLGGTPFELGAAFATYGIGRAVHHQRIARAGADLVRAELIAESLTLAIKQTTRRARPSGSGFSFPSGHTTAAFASATVLQHHFGWKIGVPAYVVAAYVGTSRIQDRRHYLSDVAFGAALGVVAGRTVTLNRRQGVALGLAPVAGGGAVVFGIRR
jgi:membrane-associated phospholipid phosphatase